MEQHYLSHCTISIPSREEVGQQLTRSTADVIEAATLAADELLGGAFDEVTLVRIALDLNQIRMSHSTHDLAASVALSVLKSVSPPNRQDALARLTLLEWFREGKVAPTSLLAFENAPYTHEKPSPP